MLTRLTLTGADDPTSIEEMFALHRRFPFIEYGILYHSEKAGTGRYPSLRWIEALIEHCGIHNDDPPPFALHLCGVTANRAFGGWRDFLPASIALLLAKTGVRLDDVFGRVQMNLNLMAQLFTAADVQAACLVHSEVNVITQHNENNKGLAEKVGALNHQVLFDASGGKGLTPDAWPPAMSDRLCGYAGGLRLENLAAEMPKIFRAAGGKDHWIDLETGLRDADDKFSLDLCEQVASLVSRELVLAV